MSESFSSKIASILNAAPTSFDPEEDINVETTARVDFAENDTYNDKDQEDELTFGNIRKRNVDLLEDVDKRYKGKKASRKRFNEWEVENDEDTDETSGDEISVSEIERNSESNNETLHLEHDFVDSDNSSHVENKTNFEHLQQNSSNEIAKGICVRQQLNMWESMLEIRIQLQKCLMLGNKFPQSCTFQNLKSTCGSQFMNKVVESKTSLTNLLDKLLNLQFLLLKRFPETKNILDGNNAASIDSDEEIPSDFEEDECNDESYENLNKNVACKKLKFNDYEHEMNKRFSLYKNYRNSVIEKWNSKTRLVNNKSGNEVNSVMNQIDYILSDKNKLIKRTQVKHTDYKIVGQSDKCDEADEADSKVYNAEIFDDTDFYHNLLRELIEYKSADITDPVQLGRQWIQLQHLRSKMKRKIDTKATKGRKIRYAVHSKLVNFMAPIDGCMWEKEAETELYNSLFGKTQAISTITK